MGQRSAQLLPAVPLPDAHLLVVPCANPHVTGRHNLRISKITEARTGSAWLRSVTLAPAGRFLPPPPTDGGVTGRRMLFIGDSLTAGAGNIGDKTCRLLAADNQNSLLSFAPLAARALRSDFQALAWSAATVGIYRLK